MNKSKEEEKQDSIEVSKPLEYILPEYLPTCFSNHTLVQHDDDTFTLSFYEVKPPPLTGSAEEKKAALEKIKTLPAYCVARIVLTPSHFKRIVNAMQQNLQRYEKKQGAEKQKPD